VEPIISYILNLAEQQWAVSFFRTELEAVHLPFLKDITNKATRQNGRYVLLLAGPPGSGKTTIAVLWETLAREYRLQITIQTLPMDGFHLPNKELDRRIIIRHGQTIPLRKIKGAPETFDLQKITKTLDDLRAGKMVTWPKYDRQIHDPVMDAIPVISKGIVVVEGNYLLLDEPGWRDLKPLADLTIFIECSETLSKDRLIARSLRGGRSSESAADYWAFSDQRNWQRIMQHRLGSDVVLQVGENGHIVRIK
jgi:pantothenate kinase